MSIILQTVLVGAALLIGSAGSVYYANQHYDNMFISEYDIRETQMNRAEEMLQMIDVFDNPTRIDVLNNGESDIVIDKIFVDGVLDETYTINDVSDNVLSVGEIMIILPTDTDGNTVLIITENKNSYTFTVD